MSYVVKNDELIENRWAFLVISTQHISLLFFFISLFACSEESIPQCVPGLVRYCPCASGGKGTQACSDDGKRFSTCECLSTTQSAELSLDHQESWGEPVSLTIKPLPHSELPKAIAREDEKLEYVMDQDEIAIPIQAPVQEPVQEPVQAPVQAPVQEDELDPIKIAKPKSQPIVEQKKSDQQAIAVLNEINEHIPPIEQNQTEVELPAIKVKKSTDLPQNLESKIIEVKAITPEPPKPTKQWWVYHDQLSACVNALDLKDDRYELPDLLSKGCKMTKLDQKQRRFITCSSQAFKIKDLVYTEQKEVCDQWVQEIKIQAKVDQNPIETPSEQVQPSQAQPSVPENEFYAVDRTWYCMCYQERYRGKVVDATGCRTHIAQCKDLERRASNGTRYIVADSLVQECTTFQGKHPNMIFNKGNWKQLNQPSMLWTPDGCVLQEQKQNKKSTPSPIQESKQPKPIAPVAIEDNPVAREAMSCSSGCWAHLATESQRMKRFGTDKIPAYLEWSKSYADQVSFILRSCLARNLGEGQDPLKGSACTDEAVDVCVRICRRAQKIK